MKFNEARKIIEAANKAKIEIKGLVTVMGTEALNHFTKSFRDQGFTDNSLERWVPRKNEFSSGVSMLRKRSRIKSGRAILVKSGNLRRSLRKINRGSYAVTIISDLPYANVHNEGILAGRSRKKMPKREFVGYSGVLSRKLENKINTKLNNIFK